MIRYYTANMAGPYHLDNGIPCQDSFYIKRDNNGVVYASAADGLGMGAGFTLAITVIGIIRELLGNGSVFGLSLFGEGFEPMLLSIMAPGGFLVFGLVLGVANYFMNKAEKKKTEEKGVIRA